MNNKIKPPKSWKDLSTHYKIPLRNEWYRVLALLQDEFNFATVIFYRQRGIKSEQLPITTGSISSPMGLGSDSVPVHVQIAGIDTYLADSMQFFLEYSCRINKEGVYYVAPSFRGESADERHLGQFYHSEAEIIGTLDNVIKLCEQYIVYLSNHFLKTLEKEILSVAGTTEHIKYISQHGYNIPKCTFEEAVRILDNNPDFVESYALYRNINSKGEAELMKYFGGYVWLTNFDHMAVPFYQKFAPGANKKIALNADLLMGIGETIGSGERHLSGQEVREALTLHQIDETPYKWYITIKDEVPVQTSGFGLGVERFFLWLLKHNDIRDMQTLPRFNGQKFTF